MSESPAIDRARVGEASIDDILLGGLPIGHSYLIEGEPGSGKTTFAIQFLLDGAKRGESLLYITLSESLKELKSAALSHGWNLDGIEIMELSSFGEEDDRSSVYTVLNPADVELTDTIKVIKECVERVKPSRIVIDSLSEVRLLSGDPLRFRREILVLKQYLEEKGATVLMLDDRASPNTVLEVHSLVHGIIRLERMANEFGAERRRLCVTKLRGSAFRGGYHDYRIVTGGICAYPRLIASEHRVDTLPGSLLSGVPNLDALLGGGLDHGTSTIVIGPAGAGKSTIAMMYVRAALAKGEKAAIYLFDENLATVFTRSDALEMPLKSSAESGQLTLRQIDPAEMSPGEFVQVIRGAVENEGVKHIVVDSLIGLLNAMPEERLLTVQLHELLTYLSQRGVTTIMTIAQYGLVGQMGSPVDLSYLADTLFLLRFFEAEGEVRKAISVVKRRTGNHERTIREYEIAPGGIVVGEPLRKFRGVLSGVPYYNHDLMEDEG